MQNSLIKPRFYGVHFTVNDFYELLQGALRTNPDLTANIWGFDDSIRKCKYYEEFVHRKT